MNRLLYSLALMVLMPLPSSAHHSYVGIFDSSKSVKVTGTVTKVDWHNPHVYFYVDVTDKVTGDVTNWAFETGNLSNLMRHGWRKTTLSPGDRVTVEAFPARDGSHVGNSRIVTTADGTRIFDTESNPYANQ